MDSRRQAEAIRRLDRLDPLDTTRARTVFVDAFRAPFKVLGGQYAWSKSGTCSEMELIERAAFPRSLHGHNLPAFRSALFRL